MATTRKFKPAKNNQAINAFLDIAVGAVRVGSMRSMQKIADRGIDTLTKHVASFADYTGEMINSYQAAILTNGKLPRGGNFNMSGQLVGKTTHGLNTFLGPRGEIRLLTSYETTNNEISYKRVRVKNQVINRVAKRNDPNRSVNPESNDTIRMPRSKHYQGFGRDITQIRTYTPTARFGMEVVFNNPTPYAKTVMENNPGSHVMPIGQASAIVNKSVLTSVTSSEIEKVVKRAKQRKR